ncbi:CCA tRNA nucleotidyltransferase [Xylanibacillus composti]|nr:CCA tRNA nucleotidyltransferase [Xylanibacillus composti]
MEREAAKVVHALRERGFPAFFVGGYVRDKWLGRPVKDVDIATAAAPEVVMDTFSKTVPTGLQHGTVTVLSGGFSYEVTTFRKETGYSDYRRPDQVEFVGALEEDLQRRDFTMNAMAAGPDGEWIDPFGGRRDLEQGRLRCVGEPAIRFQEDALRMMRCVRFAAEYSLQIESGTWQALLEHRHLLKHVAMERVGAELARIMDGADPYRGLGLLYEAKLPLHWAESGPIPHQAWGEAVAQLASADFQLLSDAEQRTLLWLLAAGLRPDATAQWSRALRYSNTVQKRMRAALLVHARLADGLASRQRWVEAVLDNGREAALRWLALARTFQNSSRVLQAIGLSSEQCEAYIHHAEKWLAQMEATQASELKLDGSDLVAIGRTLGRKPGPWISHVQQWLLLQCAMGEVQNDPDALRYAAQMYMRELADKEEIR